MDKITFLLYILHSKFTSEGGQQMGRIVYLDNFRKGLVCKRSGITFPCVYRSQGYYYALDETGTLTQSSEIAPPTYGLEENEETGFFNPVCSLIRHLTPGPDTGRLLVRHHSTDLAAQGYLDALMDQMDHSDSSEIHDYTPRSIYRTRQGIFSIAHVPERAGKGEDCLLVYTVKMNSRLGLIDHSTVVKSDGSIAEDPDSVLWQTDE